MTERKPSRGIQGALVKLWRGGDHELTVTGRTGSASTICVCTSMPAPAGGAPVHPRCGCGAGFPDGDRSHQLGYTLVNPDPAAGTVDIDFALHDGLATRWAIGARPGDTLEVTVLGSNFALPTPDPAGYLIVGDTASLPAINSLLDAIGDTPARVFLAARATTIAACP